MNGVDIDSLGFVLATSGPRVAWYVPVGFEGKAVTVDGSGQITTAGVRSDGGAAIAKFDATRERFYEHVFTAYPAAGQPSAAVLMFALSRLAPDHGVVVAGNLRGHADLALGFGGKPLTSGLGDDAFVARSPRPWTRISSRLRRRALRRGATRDRRRAGSPPASA